MLDHGGWRRQAHEIKAMNTASQIILDLADLYNKTEGSSDVVYYSVLFGGIGIGLAIFYYIAYFSMSRSGACDNNSIILKVAIRSIPEMLILVMFILACNIVARYSGLSTTLNFLINNNCVDADMINFMKTTKDDIIFIQTIALATLISGLISLILFVGNIVILCVRK